MLHPFTSSIQRRTKWIACWLLGGVLGASLMAPAVAEVSTVRLERQYGIHYLPLVIMEHEKLVEKQARALGLNLKVGWNQVSGGASANDALLAGAVDFASMGVGPLIQIWDKSKGISDVRAVAAVSNVPMTLTTRDPRIRTIADFKDSQKIALPAVKTSMQAVTLEMAAAKAWGDANYQKLDKFTVSMKHPDAMAAMLSGQGEITAHFTAAPYDFEELQHPGIHKVLDSYEVYGGPATLILLATTKKFHDQNPKVYKAVLGALNQAMGIIRKDKRQAAKMYLDVTKEKMPVNTMVKILNNPKIQFTATPSATLSAAQFMHKVGRIKSEPASWKDLFFPEVYNLKGS